jgi:hypothetical protein
MDSISQLFLVKEMQSQRRDKRLKNLTRKQSVDHKILVKALGEGHSPDEAAMLAGAKSKDRSSLASTTRKILRAHPEYQEIIKEKIRERKLQLLDAMSEEKMEQASLSQQAVAFGIMVDKGELLEGRPTQRVASDVDLEVLKEGNYRSNLMAFILGRLSAGRQDKPKD